MSCGKNQYENKIRGKGNQVKDTLFTYHYLCTCMLIDVGTSTNLTDKNTDQPTNQNPKICGNK